MSDMEDEEAGALEVLLLELPFDDVIDMDELPEAVADEPGPEPTAREVTAAVLDAELAYHGMPHASGTLSTFQPLAFAMG